MLTKWTQRHPPSRRFWNFLVLEHDKIEDLKAGVESLHKNMIRSMFSAITFSIPNEFSVETDNERQTYFLIKPQKIKRKVLFSYLFWFSVRQFKLCVTVLCHSQAQNCCFLVRDVYLQDVENYHLILSLSIIKFDWPFANWKDSQEIPFH